MSKYTLIITEKPDAANRIATALDEQGSPKKSLKNGVPIYHANRGGDIMVVPALGHLYTITAQKGTRGYPVFDYRWVPRYVAERKAKHIRVWLDVISKLALDAEAFVDACDFDVEGSIIGFSILHYACSGKDAVAKRMKYSTLTEEELQDAYAHLLPHLDFRLIEAGLTRHELDWLFGINLSRALTQAAKNSSGQYATLSTGRVQGPTLRFLEEREREIRGFVPSPYWTLTAKVAVGDVAFDVEYGKSIQTEAEATALRDSCRTRQGIIVSVEAKECFVAPPVPFDLGSLQSEAYKHFRYTPMRTLSILQRLYLDALVSYPRTSSQKLPASIGYRGILGKLTRAASYSKHAAELLVKADLKPNEGKKTDPAHPAIYPTGNFAQKPLGSAEKNVYDLVVKRFLAVFGDPALRQCINATVNLNDVPFGFAAARTLREGWFKLYRPYVALKDDAVPPLAEGCPVDVKRLLVRQHFTQPPPRYNPRSLLQKMEKEEIGTKATRAAIIDILQKRRYLNGADSLSVSDLGLSVTEVLEQYCPTLVSSEMTRTLEAKMEQIERGQETKQQVLSEAVETLKAVTAALKSQEAQVGAHLSRAIADARQEEKTVGKCPGCGGKLVVLRSKKSGKRFVGCMGYFEGKCKVTYPLPQTGTVKPLPDACKSCGAPVVAVYMRGRKAWRLCLNPQCSSKAKKQS
ncbi:MAG: DNA topoisomerase I [Candidatus Bathyarchaeota archaeon]|nr:DNA topoisomerase I [Candidatus Bathyarchaeota archaeon]